MSKETQNHRTSERQELAFYVPVELDGIEEAIMVDLSDGGAKFMTSEEIAPGNSLVCRIPADENTKEELSFRVDVAWCKPGVRLGYFDIGCQIPVKDDTMKDAMDKLIANFSMRSYR